ncbi:SGNH/GDSL hydrolase family protein [Rhizobium etli]|nr:SGNH/GDSL hydrolase family protein [Rhizobium etli]
MLNSHANMRKLRVFMRNYAISGAVFGFLLLSCGPVLAGEHINIRDTMILSHLAQLNEDGVLVLGDSIIEAWLGEPFGRCRMINAGLGGGGIKDVSILVTAISRSPNSSKLKEVIVAIGVNDARRGQDLPADYVERWKTDYARLIEQLQSMIPAVTASTILPVEPGMPLGADYFDPSLIDQLNDAIREVVQEKAGVRLLDMNQEIKRIEWQGHYTVDGVHPAAKTYQVIAEKLLSGLSGSCAAANK